MVEKLDVKGPIPREEAERLCKQLQQENRGRWWSFGGLMCWGCLRASKGEFSKMCVGTSPDYRGCLQVNRRFEAEARAGTHDYLHRTKSG